MVNFTVVRVQDVWVCRWAIQVSKCLRNDFTLNMRYVRGSSMLDILGITCSEPTTTLV
jgi:hypothetical protein